MDTDKRPMGRPPREKTTEEKIMEAYVNGSSSLQDIARIHGVDLNRVLEITGNSELSTIEVAGDMISQEEAGRNASMNLGEQYKVPYTLN